tara:strand:+ start:2621 stop:3478 length:858 start_codon:yes stop_codon:yes gene_type:complete
MKCDECNSNENEYDETLGERVCKDCGLVLVTEMFEETVHLLDSVGNLNHSSDKGHLGSVITGKGSYKFNRFGKNSVIPKHIQMGLMHCNMVLGVVAPDLNLKERVEKLYMNLLTKNVFGRSQYEARATAVVYYVLKENGTPHSFADVSAEFSPAIKVVKRLVRKINQIHRNSVSYAPVNPQYLLGQTLAKINVDDEFKRQCNKMLEHFEVKVQHHTFNKGRSYYACIVWITANQKVRNDITKDSIAEKTGYSRFVLWRQTKAILELASIYSVRDVRGKELNEIGE